MHCASCPEDSNLKKMSLTLRSEGRYERRLFPLGKIMPCSIWSGYLRTSRTDGWEGLAGRRGCEETADKRSGYVLMKVNSLRSGLGAGGPFSCVSWEVRGVVVRELIRKLGCLDHHYSWGSLLKENIIIGRQVLDSWCSLSVDICWLFWEEPEHENCMRLSVTWSEEKAMSLMCH